MIDVSRLVFIIHMDCFRDFYTEYLMYLYSRVHWNKSNAAIRSDFVESDRADYDKLRPYKSVFVPWNI